MNDQISQESEGWEWACVEIMGFRKHYGRVREVEQFGAKMCRVDVPIKGDPANGWETHVYAAGALFGMRLTDEASVMTANKPYEPPARVTYRPEPEPETIDGEAEDDDRPF